MFSFILYGCICPFYSDIDIKNSIITKRNIKSKQTTCYHHEIRQSNDAAVVIKLRTLVCLPLRLRTYFVGWSVG